MKLQYRAPAIVAIMLWAAFALNACETMRDYNPMAAAETTEQRAYALYGSFVIFEEKAADLVESGAIPQEVSEDIIEADERAKPVADSLLDAVAEYEAIKAQLAEGTTTEERFVVATNNLNSWVTRAAPLINNFVNAVKGEL